MIRNLAFALLALPTLAIGVPGAYADEQADGDALIRCEPQAGYFFFETFNTFEDNAAHLAANGIFPAPALQQKPFVCKLPGHVVTVEGRDIRNGRGPCGANFGVQVRVLVDGIPVRGPRGGYGHGDDSGWMELSGCFERRFDVRIRSLVIYKTNTLLNIELCRHIADDDSSARQSSRVIGECRRWESLEELKAR